MGRQVSNARFYFFWPPHHLLTQLRLLKLLELSAKPTLLKWKLCTKVTTEPWSHPSGLFTLLGDAVHATLPYCAAGAGMALEDGAVLGEIFSRLPKDKQLSSRHMKHALSIYESCRRSRTHAIVERSYLQQYLYHLDDGEEQARRDEMMRMSPTRAGEALVWRDPGFAPWLLGYDHMQDVDAHWPKGGFEEGNAPTSCGIVSKDSESVCREASPNKTNVT